MYDSICTSITIFIISYYDIHYFIITIIIFRNLQGVSGQLAPEENCPPVRVGVSVKWGSPDNFPRGKFLSG